MARDYHAFLASCAAGSCGHAGQLFAGDGAVTSLVNATMAVPLLFGLFWVRHCWPGSSRTARTTFTVFTGLRFLPAEYARPHYLTPVSRSLPPFSDNAAPHGSLVLSNATLGPDGHNYTAGLSIQQVPAACRGNGQQAAGQLNSCLASHGFHTQILYQPASRFWAFQGIEAGIFIVLAAALVAVAYRMVLARDG